MQNRTTSATRHVHPPLVGGGDFGRLIIVLVGAVAATSSLPAEPSPIQFRPGTPVMDGGAPLLPGEPCSGYAIPCVTDWNGDGKKDLLVGYQPDSQIALYLNQGTDAQPRFTNFTVLKTGDGSIIKFPCGNCGAPAPWCGDFDGDGKRDLVVGAGADGKVWFFRNTNTDAAPLLAPGVKLKTEAGDLSVGTRATPYVTDWDEDGLPDLLCGAGDGYIYFFKNTNTISAPIYAPAVKLQAGGTNLFLGIRSVVRVFDWDGDGLKDLVCSSDTGVYWCRNTNSNSNPILLAPVALCVPTTNGLVPLYTASRMRLDLTDWNNDGVTDLLLGDSSGKVWFFEGYRLRITGVTPQAANQVVLRWDSAPYLRYQVLTSGGPASAWSLAVSNLPSGGNSTPWTNATHCSQQFFRVQIVP